MMSADATAKLSAVGIAFALIAAVAEPFTPPQVFIGLILVSMACSTVGLMVSQYRWKRMELERKMEAAFGVNPNRVQ